MPINIEGAVCATAQPMWLILATSYYYPGDGVLQDLRVGLEKRGRRVFILVPPIEDCLIGSDNKVVRYGTDSLSGEGIILFTEGNETLDDGLADLLWESLNTYHYTFIHLVSSETTCMALLDWEGLNCSCQKHVDSADGCMFLGTEVGELVFDALDQLVDTGEEQE